MDAAAISAAQSTVNDALPSLVSLFGGNITVLFTIAYTIAVAGFLIFLVRALYDFIWLLRDRFTK